MNCINSVILEGTIKSIGKINTSSGSKTRELTLCTTRELGGNKREETYIDCILFGDLSNIKLEEGKECRVVGRVCKYKWTTETGMRRAKLCVLCEFIDTIKKETVNEEN